MSCNRGNYKNDCQKNGQPEQKLFHSPSGVIGRWTNVFTKTRTLGLKQNTNRQKQAYYYLNNGHSNYYSPLVLKQPIEHVEDDRQSQSYDYK